MGEVKQPGQPTRRYLAGGLSLTSNQRAEAERVKMQLEQALLPGGDMGQKARAVIVSKLIMSSGGPALTPHAVTAKAEAYSEALDDIPPWAVAAAVRAWRRSECGDRNYDFAPSSGTLREICLEKMLPYTRALESTTGLLEAMTLDRAMDSTPIEQPATKPHLKII
jgi:hypothetical protein